MGELTKSKPNIPVVFLLYLYIETHHWQVRCECFIYKEACRIYLWVKPTPLYATLMILQAVFKMSLKTRQSNQ